MNIFCTSNVKTLLKNLIYFEKTSILSELIFSLFSRFHYQMITFKVSMETENIFFWSDFSHLNKFEYCYLFGQFWSIEKIMFYDFDTNFIFSVLVSTRIGKSDVKVGRVKWPRSNAEKTFLTFWIYRKQSAFAILENKRL